MKHIIKQLIKIARELIDKETSFFKSLIKYKVINKKQTYKDKFGKYYQFDQLHGHWQKYSKYGQHYSVVDKNGCFLSKGIKGRKIDIK